MRRRRLRFDNDIRAWESVTQKTDGYAGHCDEFLGMILHNVLLLTFQRFLGDPMLSDCCTVCPVLPVMLMYCGLGSGAIVLDGAQQSLFPSFRPLSVVANGRPSPLLLSSCTSSSPPKRWYRKKGGTAPSNFRPSSPPKGEQPPLFGPCLLWPNGWIDHYATWYGGRPQPRRHCVRWGPSSPPQWDTAPNLQPMSVVVKGLDRSRC